MIFFEIFFIALSNGTASSATGIILPYCPSCVNCFFICFFEMALSGCGVSLWLALPLPREQKRFLAPFAVMMPCQLYEAGTASR